MKACLKRPFDRRQKAHMHPGREEESDLWGFVPSVRLDLAFYETVRSSDIFKHRRQELKTDKSETR